MGKVTLRDGTPEDTADWPDYIVGQPVAGPGSPGQPIPGSHPADAPKGPLAQEDEDGE